MIRFFRGLFLSALLLGAGGVHAQIDRATTESLLRKSGLWEQLASIAPQAESGLQGFFAQAGMTPSAAELARISSVIRESYAPSRLREFSMDVISKKLGAQHVPRLQRWFDSPVGKTVTKLEEQASAESVDPQVQMQQGTALLQNAEPARRKLLEELVKETSTAETWAQITINTSLAAWHGAASVSAQAPMLSLGEFKAALEAQRPQMLQGFSAMALALFARAYAPLSTPHLKSYVAFLKSEAGRQYNALGMEALDAALTQAAADIGRKLPSTKDQANI